jgi:saccharopine dehydrogenase-like NADP-dependent oxidoreductase
MRHLVGLGWLSEKPLDGFEGTTYAELSRYLIGDGDDAGIADATARHLGLLPFAAVLRRMQWLGLFSSRRLPASAASPLDCLHKIAVDKMALHPSERDMIVMHHDFVAELPEGRTSITSTLVDVGRTGYYTAIARTVGLPAAIAAKLIMRGAISEPGVHIPVSRDIYEPILDELDRTGLRFEDRQRPA